MKYIIVLRHKAHRDFSLNVIMRYTSMVYHYYPEAYSMLH